MPFISVKVAGLQLQPTQTAAIQQGITTLMASVLKKQAALTAVFVDEVPVERWSIGGEAVARAAHVDATISEGTNTPEQKAQFIADTDHLLREVLGAELPVASYIVLREVPKDSWGYGGLTQAHRAKTQTSL